MYHRVWKQNRVEEWVIIYKEIEKDPEIKEGLDLSWIRADCNPEGDVTLCMSQETSLSPKNLSVVGKPDRLLEIPSPGCAISHSRPLHVHFPGKSSLKLPCQPGSRGDSRQGQVHIRSTMRAQDPPCFWFLSPLILNVCYLVGVFKYCRNPLWNKAVDQ